MSEATDSKDEEVLQPIVAEPAPKTTWQRLREWLFAAMLLFVISSAVDATIGLISGKKPIDCNQLNSPAAKKVCSDDQKIVPAEGQSLAKRLSEANQYVISEVNSLDPFNFAKIFYKYLLDGIPPRPEAPYSFSQPIPKALAGVPIVTFIYRAIPGVIYTALALATTGWVSIFTAMVALLFGYAVQRSSWKDDEFGHRLMSLLLIPIIGGGFIWVLIQLMSFASYLLGGILNAAEASTAFSVLGTTVWAVFKKTENDTTDKFIKWSKERIFN